MDKLEYVLDVYLRADQRFAWRIKLGDDVKVTGCDYFDTFEEAFIHAQFFVGDFFR